MARYIDADNLVYEIKNVLFDWGTVNGIMGETILKQMITDIQNQPTADVVEVVRCKDCKYYGYYCFRNTEGKHICEFWTSDPYDAAMPEDDDFCSRGERRN